MNSQNQHTSRLSGPKLLKLLVAMILIPLALIIGGILWLGFQVWSQSGELPLPDHRHLIWGGFPKLPRWSPDGDSIVFGHSDSLFRVTIDGAHLLTLSGSGTDDPRDISRSPSVSSTNSLVAFEAFKHKTSLPWNTEYQWDILSITSDTSDRTRLTESKSFDLSPRWSPDGSRLAFVSDRLFKDERYENKFRIYTMAPDGSDIRRAAQFPGDSHVSPPVWSPNGQRIAFVSGPNPLPVAGRLYSMQPDGLGLTEFGEALSQPAWSPDSKRLAFVRRDGPIANLYVTPSDRPETSKLVQLERVGPPNIWNVDWSPDGSQLLLSGGPLLMIVNSDGTGLRQLADLPLGAGGLHASWSRDGSKIAVYAPIQRRDVAWGLDAVLFTMKPDGSDRRILARFDRFEIDGSIDQIVPGHGSPFPEGLEFGADATPTTVTHASTSPRTVRPQSTPIPTTVRATAQPCLSGANESCAPRDVSHMSLSPSMGGLPAYAHDAHR